MITVRATAFDPAPVEGGTAGIHEIAAAEDPALSRFSRHELTRSERPELTSAGIVISGGRGLKGPDDFYAILEPCAKALGGAIGASRAAVDEGWVPTQLQVGLTGKIVSPKLYVACAISGAAQHMAGCGYSKTIVAVNRDPDAPIYQRANIGIVGDYKKVIPAFQAKCAELLG